VTDVDEPGFRSDDESNSNGRVHRCGDEGSLSNSAIRDGGAAHGSQEDGIVRIRVAPVGVFVSDVRI
jgi:hypothetical protein